MEPIILDMKKTIGKKYKNTTLLLLAIISSILFLSGFTYINQINAFNIKNNPKQIIAASDLTDFFDKPAIINASEDKVEIKKKPQVSLGNFISSVENENSWQIVGIYVKDKFEISVVLQPSSNLEFISGLENTATQFNMASDYGTTGMLAHNYLAGEYFFELETGDVVYVIFGDGNINKFAVNEIKQYQAMSPYSPDSNFRDLSNDTYLTASNLFYSIYQSDGELVLQTCIDSEGIESWGRYFVIAEPIF